jgi:hypothetical protein
MQTRPEISPRQIGGPDIVGAVTSGKPIQVRAAVDLAGLNKDIRVEAVLGRVGPSGALEETEDRVPATEESETVTVFATEITPRRTGRLG